MVHCPFTLQIAAVVPWAASEEAKTSGGGDGSLQAMDVVQWPHAAHAIQSAPVF